MNDKPIVSVIVPTFNRAALLKETVDSILNQSFSNIELLIVDNMSTDGTESYVRGISDPRVCYLRNPNNGIIAINRNLGMKNAKGDYFAFCDDDDVWLENKLTEQLKVFDVHPELFVVATNGYYIRGNNQGTLIAMRGDRRVSFRDLLKTYDIVNSSVVMRRSALTAIGYLDEDKRLRGSEDYDFWLRVLRHSDNSIMIINDKLIKYRIHPNNLNSLASTAVLPMPERLRIILQKHNDRDSALLAQSLNDCQYALHKFEVIKAVYDNTMKLSDLFKDGSIAFRDKMIISTKYLGQKILPFIKKYYKTNLPGHD